MYYDSYTLQIIKKRKLAKGSLMYDTLYMKWLEGYTEKNDGRFCDDDWLYSPETTNIIIKEQLNKLRSFYHELANYAKTHGKQFEYAEENSGEALYVTFNRRVYKIGYITGLGGFYYCEQVDLDEVPFEPIIFREIVKENNQNLVLNM